MDRKPVSDAELAALGKFQGEIDRSSNFRQQAFDHNLGRNTRVAKLLGYLGLLRQARVSLKGTVGCVAAVRQNFSSSQSMTHMGLPMSPQQAAHFLPGQVTIGGKPVWRFAANPRTQGQIEFLFAEVEHLPLAFNQADTAAEAKGKAAGLCAALAHGCGTVAGRTAMARPTPGKIPMDLVQAGYEDWHRDSISALRNALAGKEEKDGIPALVGNAIEGYTMESIAARSGAPKKQWNRDDSLRILQYYLEDQQQRTWRWMMTCQWVFRDVETAFQA